MCIGVDSGGGHCTELSGKCPPSPYICSSKRELRIGRVNSEYNSIWFQTYVLCISKNVLFILNMLIVLGLNLNYGLTCASFEKNNYNGEEDQAF